MASLPVCEYLGGRDGPLIEHLYVHHIRCYRERPKFLRLRLRRVLVHGQSRQRFPHLVAGRRLLEKAAGTKDHYCVGAGVGGLVRTAFDLRCDSHVR